MTQHTGDTIKITRIEETCPNGDHACNLRGYCVNKNCGNFQHRGDTVSELTEAVERAEQRGKYKVLPATSSRGNMNILRGFQVDLTSDWQGGPILNQCISSCVEIMAGEFEVPPSAPSLTPPKRQPSHLETCRAPWGYCLHEDHYDRY